MSQHEQYTVPPGFSVSGGSGGNTKLQPVLIDPATLLATGDTLVWNGTLWVPQAPSVQRVTVLVSSTELVSLHTTPKTLVAPPGGGSRVHVLGCDVEYLVGTVSYDGGGTLLAGPTIGGVIDFATHTVGGVSSDAGGDTLWRADPISASSVPLAGAVGAAFSLFASSPWTGGNGILRVTVVSAVV